jgi:hypothetical protein
LPTDLVSAQLSSEATFRYTTTPFAGALTSRGDVLGCEELHWQQRSPYRHEVPSLHYRRAESGEVGSVFRGDAWVIVHDRLVGLQCAEADHPRANSS